jgi:hypothetical protein
LACTVNRRLWVRVAFFRHACLSQHGMGPHQHSPQNPFQPSSRGISALHTHAIIMFRYVPSSSSSSPHTAGNVKIKTMIAWRNDGTGILLMLRLKSSDSLRLSSACSLSRCGQLVAHIFWVRIRLYIDCSECSDALVLRELNYWSNTS